jgi:hypothetical protein
MTRNATGIGAGKNLRLRGRHIAGAVQEAPHSRGVGEPAAGSPPETSWRMGSIRLMST